MLAMICRLFANTVMHLSQQDVLLLQELCRLSLGGAPLGDVFDRHKNQLAVISLLEHLPGVQEHRASSDPGEFLLDFVRLHHGVARQDLLQQHPQLGDVPLAVPQRVDRTAFDILNVELERQIERTACGDHAQVPVEDQQRLADRVHDGLGQHAPIIDVQERLAIGPSRYVRRE